MSIQEDLKFTSEAEIIQILCLEGVASLKNILKAISALLIDCLKPLHITFCDIFL